MKVTFPSENDKKLALEVAQRSNLEDCGKLYIYMISEAIIDETMTPPKVEEESLVDESIEQIKL